MLPGAASAGTLRATRSWQHREVELELRQLWSLDVVRGRAGDALFDDLCSRHREPHRRYHGLAHVLHVLRSIGELLPANPVPDPGAVRLAAWFHDAIYDAASTTNELDSADLARRSLGPIGIAAQRLDAIERLVRATAHLAGAGGTATGPAVDAAVDTAAVGSAAVDAAVDIAAAVLLDADLAVLAAEPAVYEAYARGVRAEYGHVPDDAWRIGRAALLHGFLSRDHLFRTAAMRAREPLARANLTAEIASLERDAPTGR